MSRNLLPVLACSVALVASAAAEPFLLRYDADKAYPEDSGWDRQLYDPDGALQRTLTDGSLTLDTTGSMLISDAYQVATSQLSPGSGETLVATWRLMVPFSAGLDGASEVSVILVNPDREYVAISIGQDYVSEDRYIWGWMDGFVSISPGQFHTYALRTLDFQSYELLVDGMLAFSSDFHWQALGTGPRAAFGDFSIGSNTSIAFWDYFEVAVVPEPSSLATLAIVALAGWSARSL